MFLALRLSIAVWTLFSYDTVPLTLAMFRLFSRPTVVDFLVGCYVFFFILLTMGSRFGIVS